jgi:hypothetical protein
MKKYVKGGLVAGGLALVLTTGIFIGQASAYQGHMHSALDLLRNARTELEAAKPDKAGHRVNAIGFVDSAIAETKAGLEAGRENGD